MKGKILLYLHPLILEADYGTGVLYISIDRFLLAVESRDLSQTDKIFIIGSFFGQAELFGKHFFLKKTFVHPGSNFLQNKSSQSSEIYLSSKKLRQMFTFSILQNLNFWTVKFTVIPKKSIWHFVIRQNWCFGQFNRSKMCNLVFLSFSGER